MPMSIQPQQKAATRLIKILKRMIIAAALLLALTAEEDNQFDSKGRHIVTTQQRMCSSYRAFDAT